MIEPTVTLRLHPTCLEKIHTSYRWRRTRKPPCEEQKVKTFLTLVQLFVEVRFSCLCSCTNDLHSDLQASILALFTQPFSRSPSSNISNSCMIVSTNQYRSAERTQPFAYRRPGGHSRQSTVHEVFEKLPGVLSELLLRIEAPDVFEGYQHSGSNKEMLFVTGSKL